MQQRDLVILTTVVSLSPFSLWKDSFFYIHSFEYWIYLLPWPSTHAEESSLRHFFSVARDVSSSRNWRSVKWCVGFGKYELLLTISTILKYANYKNTLLGNWKFYFCYGENLCFFSQNGRWNLKCETLWSNDLRQVPPIRAARESIFQCPETCVNIFLHFRKKKEGCQSYRRSTIHYGDK